MVYLSVFVQDASRELLSKGISGKKCCDKLKAANFSSNLPVAIFINENVSLRSPYSADIINQSANQSTNGESPLFKPHCSFSFSLHRLCLRHMSYWPSFSFNRAVR
jgi:hypothetical protein